MVACILFPVLTTIRQWVRTHGQPIHSNQFTVRPRHIGPRYSASRINNYFAISPDYLFKNQQIAELLIIRESLGGKESKNGTFYVDSSASRLLISLYYLKAEDTGLEIDKFNIYQPNGLLMNISDDNIVKNGFYSLIVEPITKELLQPVRK